MRVLAPSRNDFLFSLSRVCYFVTLLYSWFPVNLQSSIGVELVSCRVEGDDALSTLPSQRVTRRLCKLRQILELSQKCSSCCSAPILKNVFVAVLILSACKRMLPIEALSFGLRGSSEANGDRADALAVGGGGEAVEAVFDFGISIGTGAVVVCRSVAILPTTF
jgi:hypothetical protein